MKAEELLRAGRLDESLGSLQETVRAKPEDPKLRVFLFQLLSILGQWERAATQLEVLSQLNAQTRLLARVYQPILQCELLREEIFAATIGSNKAEAFRVIEPFHRSGSHGVFPSECA